MSNTSTNHHPVLLMLGSAAATLVLALAIIGGILGANQLFHLNSSAGKATFVAAPQYGFIVDDESGAILGIIESNPNDVTVADGQLIIFYDGPFQNTTELTLEGGPSDTVVDGVSHLGSTEISAKLAYDDVIAYYNQLVTAGEVPRAQSDGVDPREIVTQFIEDRIKAAREGDVIPALQLAIIDDAVPIEGGERFATVAFRLGLTAQQAYNLRYVTEAEADAINSGVIVYDSSWVPQGAKGEVVAYDFACATAKATATANWHKVSDSINKLLGTDLLEFRTSSLGAPTVTVQTPEPCGFDVIEGN